eukprot:9086491-Pyramimonas_sp.AAC.1
MGSEPCAPSTQPMAPNKSLQPPNQPWGPERLAAASQQRGPNDSPSLSNRGARTTHIMQR